MLSPTDRRPWACTQLSLPLELVRRSRQAIDLRGTLESTIATHDSERPRGQEAEGVGHVQDAQDAQEIRAVLVGPGRIDEDDFLDVRVEQGGIGGDDAGGAFADDAAIPLGCALALSQLL